MTDSIGTLFFKDKQIKLLLVLSNNTREWHISELSKEANVTYVHTSKFISKCEAYGVVASEKHGRIKRLYLTDKGKEIVKNLNSMIEKIGVIASEPDQQAPQKAPAPAQKA